MNPRTTGWLALVAAAVAVFVYLYEIRGAPARRAAADAEALLFPGVDPSAVTGLRILRPGEPETRVARAESGWRLEAPVVGRADPGALDAMTRALASLRSHGRIEDPAAPGVYGLGADAILVSFASGARTFGLRLGRETPVGPGVYAAAVGSGEEREAIHMVPSASAALFDRSADDLRDRRVLVFEPDEVERLEIDAPSGRVVLERDDRGWAIREPEPLRADPGSVARLLSDLALLRAQDVLDGGALPAAERSFRLEGAGLPGGLQLALGPDEGGSRLAEGRDGDLFRVRDALVAHLPTLVEALRAAEEPPADVSPR